MDEIFGLSMTTIMVVLLVVLAICLASVAWVALRQRVVFKMGVRNIPRRKTQTALIIIGLMLCFAFYFVDKFATLMPESIAGLLQYLSVDYHFENIARGVIDTRDVLFYLSLTAVGLTLTTRSLAGVRQ